MWMVIKVKELNHYGEYPEVICTCSHQYYAELVADALQNENIEDEHNSYIAEDMNKLPLYIK